MPQRSIVANAFVKVDSTDVISREMLAIVINVDGILLEIIFLTMVGTHEGNRFEIEPIKLPDRMNPDLEKNIRIRIDPSPDERIEHTIPDPDVAIIDHIIESKKLSPTSQTTQHTSTIAA